jgi:hypothetical protein
MSFFTLALLVIVLRKIVFCDLCISCRRFRFPSDLIELLAGQYLYRTKEIDIIEMYNEIYNVTATSTLTTIKNAFLWIDGKSVVTTTARAGANLFLSDALQADAAPRNLVLNRHSASGVQPR